MQLNILSKIVITAGIIFLSFVCLLYWHKSCSEHYKSRRLILIITMVEGFLVFAIVGGALSGSVILSDIVFFKQYHSLSLLSGMTMVVPGFAGALIGLAIHKHRFRRKFRSIDIRS